MRAILAYLSTKKLTFLLTALFGLSILISTAAVGRGGGEPVLLYAQQDKKHSSPGRQPPPSQYRSPPEPASEYKYFHEAGDNLALARTAPPPTPNSNLPTNTPAQTTTPAFTKATSPTTNVRQPPLPPPQSPTPPLGIT